MKLNEVPILAQHGFLVETKKVLPKGEGFESEIRGLLEREKMILIVGEQSDTYCEIEDDGDILVETFSKGKDPKQKKRSVEIVSRLKPEDGVLDEILRTAIKMHDAGKSPIENPELTPRGAVCIRALVDAYVGEKGRAMFVHSVLLSAIKLVSPTQDVRLHKTRWKGGIDMRSIDRKCVTAWFNSRDMGIRLNPDGLFMTRTFAENYPYVLVFQADIKGPKTEWLEFIDGLQRGRIQPLAALQALLYGAYLRNIAFENICDNVRKIVTQIRDSASPIDIITEHISMMKNGGSRLLEIAIHSLMQCAYEASIDIPQLGRMDKPAPLKPMRAPDKKAGDVGDIQFRHSSFVDKKGNRHIEYAVDAKYGINILDVEIIRLNTHLEDQDTPQPYLTGLDFVGLEKPSISNQNPVKIAFSKLEHEFDVKIRSLSLAEFSSEINQNGILDGEWIERYSSVLMKENKGYGVVTEITTDWLLSLQSMID